MRIMPNCTTYKLHRRHSLSAIQRPTLDTKLDPVATPADVLKLIASVTNVRNESETITS